MQYFLSRKKYFPNGHSNEVCQHKVIVKWNKKTAKKSGGQGFPYWGGWEKSPHQPKICSFISPTWKHFAPVDSSILLILIFPTKG